MTALTEGELEKYMNICISLARETPREIKKPYVGSLVLSKEKDIVGAGNKSFLDNTSYIIHAERNAIIHSGDLARGGTLFTTLEPCVKVRNSQVLKSCAELIVDSGVETVVMAIEDSSPSIHRGSGLIYLRESNLEVILYDRLNHTQQDLISHWHFKDYKTWISLGREEMPT